MQRGLAIGLLSVLTTLSGCGLYVPRKHLLRPDVQFNDPDSPEAFQSSEGRDEANIIGNLRCEIENGIYLASSIKHDGQNNTTYLRDSWGTQVTLKLTWEEQSDFSPGFSVIRPLSNSQSRSLGLAGSASSHATRIETVTFLYENRALYDAQVKWLNNTTDNPKGLMSDCSRRETGTMIRSNLKIAEFIVDKATIASLKIASTDEPKNAPFSTFQEQLTFVGSYGGSFTPTLTLTRFTANADSKLLSGVRTITGDVTITLGPLKEGRGGYEHALGDLPTAIHAATVIGSATASSISSQRR